MNTITVTIARYDMIALAAISLMNAHNENLKAITLLQNGCFEEAQEVLMRSVWNTIDHAHAICGIVNEGVAKEKVS